MTHPLSVQSVTLGYDQNVYGISDFSQADLEGADFDQADLVRAVFTGANLLNTDFTGADLGGAGFSGATTILTGVNFADADLYSTSYSSTSGADFSGNTTFDISMLDDVADARGLQFVGSDLSSVDFTDVASTGNIRTYEDNLSYANFSSATLTNANFTDVILSSANFSSATLTNTIFTGANLNNASFDFADDLTLAQLVSAASIQGVGLSNLDLTSWNFATLPTLNLSSASFENSILTTASFAGVNLDYADFTGTTDLTIGQLDGASSVHGITLDGLTVGWDFTNVADADLGAASFVGSTVSGANFTGVDLDNANFGNSTGLSLAQLNSASSVSGISLSGLTVGWDFTNVAGKDLKNASFAGATVSGADFTGVDLDNASFSSSTGLSIVQLNAASSVRSIDLSNLSTMSGWDFRNLAGDDLYGAYFDNSDVSGAFFNGVDLSNARFTSGNSSGADFTGATLTGVWFDGSDVSGANFTNADLTNTDFWGTDVSAAIFTGANLTNGDFRNATLTNAIFTNVNLTNGIFYDANVTNANFTNANLSYVDFDGATGLTLGQLQLAASIQGMQLDDQDFSGESFTGMNLTEVTFRGTDLTNASFSGSNLTDTNFYNSNLSGVNLSGRDLASNNLNSANLSGGNLSNTNLSSRTLSGTNLSGANLNFANLANTVLQDVTMTNPITGGSLSENVTVTGNSRLTFDHSVTIDGTGAFTLSGSSILTMEDVGTQTSFKATTLTIADTAEFVLNDNRLVAKDVVGNLTLEDGVFGPGNSPAVSTVTGNLFIDSAAAIEFEIAGTTQGTGYDFLTVTEDATINGTVKLSLVGFDLTTAVGTTFDFLDVDGTLLVDGAVYVLPWEQYDGVIWDTSNFGVDGTITLTAVPEPTTCALLAGMLVFAASIVRRRR